MSTTAEWVLIRATGMSAVVLLTASMVLGLMLSSPTRSTRWPAIVTKDLHQFVTGLSLWMVAAHATLLIVDSFVNVSLRDLFVPFMVDQRRIATGLGSMAFVTLSFVWLTSINKDRIGQRVWRKLHFLTFLVYLLAMGHGVFGGTDTRQIWAWPIYAASLVLVGGLTIARVRTARRGGAAMSTRPARTPAAVARPGAAVTKRAQPAPATLPPLDPRGAPIPARRRGPVRL